MMNKISKKIKQQSHFLSDQCRFNGVFFLFVKDFCLDKVFAAHYFCSQTLSFVPLCGCENEVQRILSSSLCFGSQSYPCDPKSRLLLET